MSFEGRDSKSESGWESLSQDEQEMVATGVGRVAVGYVGELDIVRTPGPNPVTYLGKFESKKVVDEPLTGDFYD